MRRLIVCVAFSVVVAGCGPESVAKKYVEALASRDFARAAALLDESAARYANPPTLELVYSKWLTNVAIGERIGSGSGDRFAVSFNALENVADLEMSAFTAHAMRDFGRSLAVVNTNGWRVVDCVAVAVGVVGKLDSKAFDADPAVSLLRRAGCDEKGANALEAVVLNGRGAQAYSAGSYEKAAEVLVRSLELFETPRAHNMLGYVLRDNKNLSNNVLRAIEHFKRAVELAPDSAEFRSSLADAYRQDGNFAGARREFEKALELDPKDKQARFFYGVNFVGLERYGDALRELEKVRKVDPDYRAVTQVIRDVRAERDRQARLNYLLGRVRRIGY